MKVDRTLRREPNFIGKARQIILPLAVAVAHGNHRLAAVAELAQRFTDVLHGRLIASGKIFQIQHDPGDVAVVFGLTNGIDDIEQGVFLQTVGCCAKQLAANHAQTVAGRGFINDDAGDVE